MESFAKYNRKNNSFHNKNKKKNFKNDNDGKNTNNAKPEINGNKFAKPQTERVYGRSITGQDNFNRNNSDRLLIQPNKTLNSNEQTLNNSDQIKNSKIESSIVNSSEKNNDNINVENREINEKVTPISNLEDNIKPDLNQNGKIEESPAALPRQSNSSEDIPSKIDKTEGIDENDLKQEPNTQSSEEISKDVTAEESVIEDIVAIKHPLCCSWTFWHAMTGTAFTNSLQNINDFNTVEDFWSLYDNIKKPSELQFGSDFSLFKHGIAPMWEDKMNANGGSIIITVKNNENDPDTTNKLWLDTLLSLIDGQTYGPNFRNICGAVVSIRPKLQRISLWISVRDETTVEDIEHNFIEYLKDGGNYSKRIVSNFKPFS